MERFFKLNNDSELAQDYNLYKTRLSEQKKFVKEFCDEKGIEAHEYDIGGDGCVNRPFSSYEQSNIALHIAATEKDVEKFNSVLTKEDDCGLRSFKRNSAIGKDFAKKCIEKQIIINLHKPMMMDYFKTVGLGRHRWEMFEYDNTYYLKVESNNLTENDVPDGFIPIKASDYYATLENLEKESKLA